MTIADQLARYGRLLEAAGDLARAGNLERLVQLLDEGGVVLRDLAYGLGATASGKSGTVFAAEFDAIRRRVDALIAELEAGRLRLADALSAVPETGPAYAHLPGPPPSVDVSG